MLEIVEDENQYTNTFKMFSTLDVCLTNAYMVQTTHNQSVMNVFYFLNDALCCVTYTETCESDSLVY